MRSRMLHPRRSMKPSAGAMICWRRGDVFAFFSVMQTGFDPVIVLSEEDATKANIGHTLDWIDEQEDTERTLEVSSCYACQLSQPTSEAELGIYSSWGMEIAPLMDLLVSTSDMTLMKTLQVAAIMEALSEEQRTEAQIEHAFEQMKVQKDFNTEVIPDILRNDVPTSDISSEQKKPSRSD
jgi:hypothetical protein